MRRAKTTWAPCADPDCRAPLGGRLGGSGNVRPTRLSGARFGIDGVLCHDCWTRRYGRVKTLARRDATGVLRRDRLAWAA